MSFVLTNPGGAALTGLAFTDTLPSGLTAPNGTTAACGGGLMITGGNFLAFTGGALAGGANCTIPVTVTGATAGVKNNTTGPISSNETGVGTTSNTATVTVLAPPTITKAFGASSITIGGTTSLDLTLTNPNATVALTGLAFTDTLPAGLTAANGTTAPCGGNLLITGGDVLTFTGGTLAGGASCTIPVTVTGASAGTQNNTTSAVTASGPISLRGTPSNTATVTISAAAMASIPVLDPWMLLSLALLLGWAGARLARR
jgi:fimbrial isopeptide formation D2 family protein